MITLIKLDDEKLQNAINNIADAKISKLLSLINNQVGTITKMIIHDGDNGEFNGIVHGESGTVTIKTITAGGYNIQPLHFRMLVKKYESE